MWVGLFKLTKGHKRKRLKTVPRRTEYYLQTMFRVKLKH